MQNPPKSQFFVRARALQHSHLRSAGHTKCDCALRAQTMMNINYNQHDYECNGEDNKQFLCPTIMSVVSQPNFDVDVGVKLKLSNDNESAHSNRRIGRRGLPCLTKQKSYDTLSTLGFDTPNNAGKNVTIPEGSNRPQIVEIKRMRVEACDYFTVHTSIDKDL